MSRIGKKPIKIPEGVTVSEDGHTFFVRGPKGELRWNVHPLLRIERDNQMVMVKPARESKNVPALWGSTRAHIQNMVDGVTKGFEKKLEIEGVGYRALLDGNSLQLSLGFSHPMKFVPPSGIQLKVEKNVVTISGIDKQLVGEAAARIRSMRPPEPYKGKGIRYQGEVIRRKAGKKAVASAG